MKIIYTVLTYYPDKDGVQSVTQKQAEYLAGMGHEIVVICTNGKGHKKCEFYNHVKILRIETYRTLFSRRGDESGFCSLLKKECRNADILINVCMESIGTVWTWRIIQKLQCRKVLYLHGIANLSRLSMSQLGIYYFYRMIKQFYWRVFLAIHWKEIEEYHAIIHIHEKDESLDYVKSKGYHHNYIVYNAVENDMFQTKKCDHKNRYFINVANYSTRKNQKMLLKYFYMANVSCGLIMIGSDDNAYYHKLLKYKRKLEKKYGNRDVKLLHHIERLETVQYIKNALAVVMTSKTEIFPLTILEAMAVGHPFISSDVGIVSCLPGGIIFHNSKELMKALQKLDQDNDYGMMLGKQGNVYAKKYLTMEHHMKSMNAVLQEVIKENEILR